MRVWFLLLSVVPAGCTTTDAPDDDTADTLPTALEVPGRPAILPPEPTSQDTLTVTLRDGSEADDLTTWTIRWFADGEAAGTGATLPATATQRGQAIHATVSREGSETRSTELVLVRNAPPAVAELTLSPDAPTRLDEIRASVVASDPDGDPLVLTYRWTVDGEPAPSRAETLPVGLHRRGAQVAVRVEVDDGAGGRAEQVASTSIVNLAPEVPEGFIVPARLRPDEELIQCVLPFLPVDADGDPVEISFAFEVDGAPYTGPTLQTRLPGDTIPKDRVGDGDAWTCDLTASDGTDASAAARAKQTAIPTQSDYIRIAQAPDALCRLDSGGRATCQGVSTNGRLDLPPGNWRDLDVSAVGLCAIDEDTEALSCFGAEPLLDTPEGAFRSVIVAEDIGVAITTNGRLTQWGDLPEGSTLPTGVYANVAAVPQGGFCATNPAGDLRCWGGVPAVIELLSVDQRFERAATTRAVVCGTVPPLGTITCLPAPTTDPKLAMAPPLTGWVDVVAGDNHFCALKDDGQVSCWGPSEVAAQGPAGVAPYGDIDAFDDTVCVISANGLTDCWGSGVGLDRQPVRVPVSDFVIDPDGRHCARDVEQGWYCSLKGLPLYEGVNPARINASFLDLGDDAICAIEQGGDVNCFGASGSPLLDGIPDNLQPYDRLAVDGAAGCTLDQLGHPTCWGAGVGLDLAPPTASLDVVLFGGRACALRLDGTPSCWGGSFAQRDQAPPPGLRLTSISLGSFACGLQLDRSIACWGYPPVVAPLPPAGPMSQVEVADGFACSLDLAGRVSCWNVGRSAPLEVPIERAARLRASGGTMCAVQFGGRVACWGDLVVR